MFHQALVLVLLSAVQVKGQSSTGGNPVIDPAAPCTVCANGATPDLDPDFAPFANEEVRTCQTTVDEVAALNTVNGDSECKDRQLLAYQLGCCRNPILEYCTVCPDGSQFDPIAKIPLGDRSQADPTCDAYQFRSNALTPLFEAGTCADTILQRSAHYCGCPNTEQQCFLCPNGQRASNPERGDAFVTRQRCEGVEYLFSLFTEEECGNGASFGVDYANFCRCNEYVKTSQAQCNMCSGGIRNPDFVWIEKNEETQIPFTRTCAEAQEFADSIISPQVCEREMAKPLAAGCECRSGGIQFLEDGSGTHGRTAMVSLSLIVSLLTIGLIA